MLLSSNDTLRYSELSQHANNRITVWLQATLFARGALPWRAAEKWKKISANSHRIEASFLLLSRDEYSPPTKRRTVKSLANGSKYEYRPPGMPHTARSNVLMLCSDNPACIADLDTHGTTNTLLHTVQNTILLCKQKIAISTIVPLYH